MLGNKRGTSAVAGGTTLISRETRIIGNVHFSGNLEIEGEVVGDVLAAPGSDAMVRLVEAGSIQGEIHAPRVMINGSVEGAVHATSHLELAPRARVAGDVHYHIIEMAAGAEVNGRLLHCMETAADPDDAGRNAAALQAPAAKVD